MSTKQMGRYRIKQLQYKNAKKLGVEIKPSTLKGKKIDVFKKGKKIASIGAIGYGDFATFKQTKGDEFANKRRIRGEVQNDLAQQIEQGRKSYYNLHSINTFTDQEIDNFLVNSSSYPDFLSTFYPEEREVFGDALLSYKKETINEFRTDQED